jgi:hypothetical protein
LHPEPLRPDSFSGRPIGDHGLGPRDQLGQDRGQGYLVTGSVRSVRPRHPDRQFIDRRWATFVTAAIAAYFGPELYFFLGSLLVSSHFAYLGTAVYSFSGEVSAWFLLAQVVATLATAVPSLLIAHRATQVAS